MKDKAFVIMKSLNYYFHKYDFPKVEISCEDTRSTGFNIGVTVESALGFDRMVTMFAMRSRQSGSSRYALAKAYRGAKLLVKSVRANGIDVLESDPLDGESCVLLREPNNTGTSGFTEIAIEYKPRSSER